LSTEVEPKVWNEGKRYPVPENIRERKRARERKLECWELENPFIFACAASLIDRSPSMMMLAINASILIESHPRVAM